MLKNYLKSTIRNLAQKKGYTFINLLGLTLGMTCFAVIMFWVTNEISYDQFHSKSDRIYRVEGHVETPSDQFSQAVTSPPVSQALKSDFPAIIESIRIDKNDAIVKSELNQFKEDGILLTDPGFFKIFDYKLQSGDPETALSTPYSIVLSRKMATKYFGSENPIGKTLKLYLYDPEGRGTVYTVTGIIENPPSNSHIQYNFLVSFSTLEENFPHMATGGWFENFIYTYVLLDEGTNPNAIENQFPAFLEKHMGDQMQQFQMFYQYSLQPLDEIYLHSDLRYELSAGGHFQYLIIFLTVGIFILILAGINYINLSTAFAVDRMKDAGIRKVNGATSGQLVLYYLFESIVLISGAFLSTILILELFEPYLSSLINKEQIDLWSSGAVYYLAGISILIGMISGLFPAIYLSSVNPVNGLKKRALGFDKSSALRKGLVVFQFSITILLLVGIFVIKDQLAYIKEKDFGFDKASLITLSVNGSDEVIQNFRSFEKELTGFANISSVTRTSTSIGSGLGNSMGIGTSNKGEEVRATIFRAEVDYEFISTYGLNLLAGRNFSERIPSDSTQAFIVNESAVQTYGWDTPEKAIGMPFHFQGNDGKIVGVVKNFNFSSLHKPIQPVCLYLLDGGFSKITIRAASNAEGNISELVSTLESIWKKHFPRSLFEFTFVDDMLAQQYQTEQHLGKLIFVFSTLSLIIACIGLYGLAGFSSKRRTKEIGVRKVLGATVKQIAMMLNAEYLRLVLVAFLIGSAGAWFLMNQWLQQFAYKTELGFGIFLIAGGIAFVIAMLTVSGQSLKAAFLNPVESLRNE